MKMSRTKLINALFGMIETSRKQTWKKEDVKVLVDTFYKSIVLKEAQPPNDHR